MEWSWGAPVQCFPLIDLALSCAADQCVYYIRRSANIMHWCLCRDVFRNINATRLMFNRMSNEYIMSTAVRVRFVIQLCHKWCKSIIFHIERWRRTKMLLALCSDCHWRFATFLTCARCVLRVTFIQKLNIKIITFDAGLTNAFCNIHTNSTNMDRCRIYLCQMIRFWCDAFRRLRGIFVLFLDVHSIFRDMWSRSVLDRTIS